MENKKIFPPLAIGIILTLAIFIGGFFWLQNQPKFGPGGMPIQIYEECVAAGNPVMETYPPQCRTKAAPVDDLSGWQTYRNEEFGFEYVGSTNLISNIRVSVYTNLSLLDSNNYPWSVIGKNLKKVNSDFSSFNNLYVGRGKCEGEADCGPHMYSMEKLRIDTVPALDLKTTSVGGNDRSVFILRGNKIFEIYHNATYPKPDDVSFEEYEVFDKILSTFKFITNPS